MTSRPVMTLALLLSLLCHDPTQAAEAGRGKIRERAKERFVQTPAARPQDISFEIPHDGLTRRYLVHIPESYNGNTPIPLLVAFHGGGGNMEYMARDAYYGLISKSDKEGFIVVFPSGFSRFDSGKFATWNAGTCCGVARDKKIDDVGFVREMTERLIKDYTIDTERIYATGMSNGAMMAYRVACELPSVFKAISAVAGTDNTLSCSPRHPVSVLHIHAKNDTHVLFDGGAGKDSFRDPSKVSDFVSVPDTIENWVKHNHCQLPPVRVLQVAGAYCDLYSACEGGSAVKLCVTEEGGHSWPGGRKPRGDSPSKAISANDQMWDFFESLEKNPPQK